MRIGLNKKAEGSQETLYQLGHRARECTTRDSFNGFVKQVEAYRDEVGNSLTTRPLLQVAVQARINYVIAEYRELTSEASGQDCFDQCLGQALEAARLIGMDEDAVRNRFHEQVLGEDIR